MHVNVVQDILLLWGECWHAVMFSFGWPCRFDVGRRLLGRPFPLSLVFSFVLGGTQLFDFLLVHHYDCE